MGQTEVYEILKESNKKLTSSEILKIYLKKYGEINSTSLSTSLYRIRRRSDISCDRNNKAFLYWINKEDEIKDEY